MKLPFGLIDGRLVTTAEVPSGRACGAVCPSCPGPLVARKGEILVHHFAHNGHQAGPDGKSPCTRGYHTALQKMAIQLLSDSGELPLLCLTAHAQRRSQLLGARQAQRQVVPAGTTLSITQVLYDRVLAPDVKPAVLCTLEGFGPLAIELNLDGPLSPEASAAYARLGISCIEIDFSDIATPRNGWLPTVEDIRKLLYSNDVKRRWVFHRDMPAAMKALEVELKTQVRQEEEERRKQLRQRQTAARQPHRYRPKVRKPQDRQSTANQTILWAFCRPCHHTWQVDIRDGRPSFVICPKCRNDVIV